MSTWTVTQAGDFINLDHVIALEARRVDSKREEWVIAALFVSDRLEVRLPGTFPTEAEAQRWLRNLLYASSAVIPEMAT